MTPGILVERSRSRTQVCSSASLADAPGCSTTTAATASPHSASGMPITAASETAGCTMSTSSISPGEMFSAPRTITSSSRPST